MRYGNSITAASLRLLCLIQFACLALLCGVGRAQVAATDDVKITSQHSSTGPFEAEDARRITADVTDIVLRASSIEPDAAAILAKHTASLLIRVAELSPETAAALAQCRGALSLKVTSPVQREVLENLRKYRGTELQFESPGNSYSASNTEPEVDRKRVPTSPRDRGTEADERGPSADEYAQLRRWTSRSGKALGEGVFVGIEDGAVRIKLKDGTVGRIRIDKLSANDQDFSKKASAALEEAEELVMEEEPKTAPAFARNDRNTQELQSPDGAADMGRLQGVWLATRVVDGGTEDSSPTDLHFLFDGQRMWICEGTSLSPGCDVVLNPAVQPKQVTVDVAGRQMKGVYEFGKPGLRLCFNDAGQPRPSEFVAAQGGRLIELRRQEDAVVSNRIVSMARGASGAASNTGGAGAQQRVQSPRDTTRPDGMAGSKSVTTMARFEAECDKICSEMLAAYRAASNSPRDIVTSCGEKLEEMGANPDKRMDGKGISAGCAKATITYFGMYSLLLMEAGARCVGQEVPDGGIVAMFDSMLADADKSLGESGDAAKYWTHVALIRSLLQLNSESNAFHADFKRQLMEGGAQPVVFVELQRMRRDIRDLLGQRYEASVEAGIKRYGPPSFPAN